MEINTNIWARSTHSQHLSDRLCNRTFNRWLVHLILFIHLSYRRVVLVTKVSGRAKLTASVYLSEVGKVMLNVLSKIEMQLFRLHFTE